MESSSAGPKRIHPGFDIDKLRREAQTRWLKPSEVLFILQNHERYSLTPKAPEKPPSGSLFLFNRRVLRFFRKDGHMWRKKKDGRTVGEAHERLKVGNVDALNCYYAHGEQNPYFQRRSYWMLDPAYEHIVLVHYREVAEGRYISGSISNLSAESFSTFNQSTSISKTHFQSFTSGSSGLHEANQRSSSPGSLEEVSSKFPMEKFKTGHLNATDAAGNYVPSPQPEVNEALRKLAEQLSLDDDDNSIYFEEKLGSQYGKSQDLGLFNYETRSSQEFRESLAHGLKCRMQGQVEEVGKQNSCSSIHLRKTLGSGNNIERKESPSWKDMLELTSNSPGINTHGRTTTLLASEGVFESPSCMTSAPERQYPSSDMTKHGSDTLLPSAEGEKISEKLAWQQLDHGANSAENRHNKYQNFDSDLSLQLSATRRFLLGCDSLIDSQNSISQLPKVEGNHASGTSTLESNSSVMILRKGNSTDWIGAIDSSIENNMYSSDLSGMWVDQSQFGSPFRTDSSLTMAQKQRFSIREISPEWAFSFESTKVVITGVFLCDPSECPWAVMFGDVEVPLEIVQEGVLRCKAPPYCAGKVPLCITSCNRESCSDIREFEFRSMPYTSSFISNSLQEKATKNAEELLLLVRLVQILLCGDNVSSIPRGGIKPEIGCFGQLHTTEDRWQQILHALLLDHEPPPDIVDFILQELLKDKLQQWLMSEYQGKDGTGRLLSKQEQGIIHMISGLGFEWALNQILDSGVGINFRDINGWTALHWAAHFGREKMVAALLAAGASSGAVTDPTPQDPVGKTPGAISAASGHKGLAAYLSEVALTGHLSSITKEQSEIAKGSTAMDADRAVESISERNVQMHAGATEDELSLKDCLAAVRNSAQAAARIQSAFRAHSFRKRQQKTSASRDEYGMTPEVIHGLSAASKYQRAFHGYRDQKFDKAALSIQKKFRGWKGRKDFLTLRQHVVKIQAHVRGHQVRKRKELLWTVGVIEKVILRWRRRGVGLRGFRAEPHTFDEVEEDIVNVFRKQKVDAALDEAMSRVLSMVDSPAARQQYRRMLEKYCQAKAKLSNGDEETSGLEDDFKIIENDDISPTVRS